MKENYYKDIGKYYDQDAQDYDSRYLANPILQKIRQDFREIVKEYPAQSMLEIGYGTGIDVVHFSVTHPERKIYGIDISSEMFRIASEKIKKTGCENIHIGQGSIEQLPVIFAGLKFDLIYIFFGALNTTADINKAAVILSESLNQGGKLVLSFVNKWYLSGMVLEIMKLNWKRAFARLKPVWGGYSPVHFLTSYCYTPRQIQKAFNSMKVLQRKGYCIVHPAWYFIRINKLTGKFSRYFWNADKLLNKTFLWRFGEYTLLVFEN